MQDDTTGVVVQDDVTAAIVQDNVTNAHAWDVKYGGFVTPANSKNRDEWYVAVPSN